MVHLHRHIGCAQALALAGGGEPPHAKRLELVQLFLEHLAVLGLELGAGLIGAAQQGAHHPEQLRVIVQQRGITQPAVAGELGGDTCDRLRRLVEHALVKRGGSGREGGGRAGSCAVQPTGQALRVEATFDQALGAHVSLIERQRQLAEHSGALVVGEARSIEERAEARSD
ncbi:MAG: hypothetical protein MI924_33020 [Chloroflexales bacterium]|nr:hypothetical protein [Chloroflexales bacterium]